MTKNQMDTFLRHFSRWASTQDDIHAVALVGSYARNTAREESDVDLVIIVKRPQAFLRNTEWTSLFGQVERTQIEDYGKLISLRVWYDDRREIEYGFAAESWARPPLEEGTLEVISGGMMVLFERGSLLSQHEPDRHIETLEQRIRRLD
jgi:predicted nucleotidyltransferase